MASGAAKSSASASSANQGSSSSGSSTACQEYVVRVPKPDKKRYHVMKFNSSLNVDITSWSQAKIERENNLKDFKTEEDMPKFGAGSEFGREMREEARKKKYGIISKKYNPDDQPWQLKVGGKSGKRYRGLREGGIAENAAYYVFMQAPDGAFEAFPISEWYHFTPVQTYKTLNAEEAEEEFGRRDKVMNYFSIMLKKRLKNEDEGEGEGDEIGKKKDKKSYKASGDFKISEMDEWVNSSDDSNEDDEEGAGSGKEDKKVNKAKDKQQKGKKKKKKKDDSDDEPLEDSDDGDEEGREVDYITDGSSSSGEEPGVKLKEDLKGVEDEEAIRKMEDSESEEENPENTNEVQEEVKEAPAKEKPTKEKKEKKEGSSSESSSDSSDSDDFDNNTSFQSPMFMQDRITGKADRKIKKEKSGSTSRSSTPTKPFDKNVAGGLKWPMSEHEKDIGNCAKKIKLEPGVSGSPSMGCSLSSDGISEDAVRRYLMRKPMTTTELLQKFKSKKTGLGRDQMVNTITQILKRLNPDKHMIKGKMYLSIKPSF